MALQVAFLGGADGIGATSIAIRTLDGWIVIDAGMNPAGAGAPALPRFDLIADAPVVAIVITHAHGDHCGALPLLARYAPHAPIYAAPATARLLRPMLTDALRLQTAQAQATGAPPPWTQRDLDAALARVRDLPVGMTHLPPTAPRTALVTAASGHLVGAVAVGVRTPDGAVLISSDIGVRGQRTPPPAARPPLHRPDLLVLEATYGDRPLPDRAAEEARLLADVGDVLARGGRVLIPAFALGRAQEAVCLLHAAMRRGDAPLAPIYLDGLAQQVAAVYARQAHALHPLLAPLIGSPQDDPFRAFPTQAVRTDADRRMALHKTPAVLVAGHGMLQGGAAARYADSLLDDPAALIALVGHVAPDTPGAALLAAMQRSDRTADWQGMQRTVRCMVRQYALSAHADADVLHAYARACAPQRVALVHGEPSARATLASRLRADGIPTELPENGAVLTLGPSTPAPLIGVAARQGERRPST